MYLIGGYDTTSASMTSIVYFLYKYPAEREKIKEEIMRVFNGDLSALKVEHLDEMEVLLCFIKEV